MIDALIHSLKEQLASFESGTPDNKTRYDYISLQTLIHNPLILLPTNIGGSFFLSKPDTGFSLLGLDSLLTLQSAGSTRFDSIKSDYSKLLKVWKNSENLPPLGFLSFAFDENDPMLNQWEHFPNTLITLPLVLIKENNGSQTLQVNIKLDPASYNSIFERIKEQLLHYTRQVEQASPKTSQSKDINTSQAHFSDKNFWNTLTHNALSAIQSGKFDKLVTSRQHSIKTEHNVCVSELIQDLIKHYPTCTILSYHSSGQRSGKGSGKTIVAASPERLLTLNHPNIQSDAIGGTILCDKTSPINTQSDSSESKKLLKEHAFIAQDIYQSLDPLCHTLKMPVSPFLMKLHNFYHLETPIQGKLLNEYDVFDVIETLHPTPAVAGFPAQDAKQWLLNHENYHRGWYTGAFGWIEGIHNGELSVLLRCALIENNQVNVYAGAGLVAESDPEVEWQETEAKMQTILEML